MIGVFKGLPPALKFLFELAWASRIRLPLLIAAAFMVTNIHMRLEINVNFEMEEQIVMQAEDAAESSGSENENFDTTFEDEISSGSNIFLSDEESSDSSSEHENTSDDDDDDDSKSENINFNDNSMPIVDHCNINESKISNAFGESSENLDNSVCQTTCENTVAHLCERTLDENIKENK